MSNYSVLVRRKLSPEAAVGFMHDLREVRQTHDSALVFLHGDGVEVPGGTVSGWPETIPGVDWCVCRTSVERRRASIPMPSSFRIATLVTFFQAVACAGRVDSLGLGGSLYRRPEPGDRTGDGSRRLLLEVGFSPADQRQRRETLEMALGAAALELDASVLFHGDGLAHLTGEAARGWAQISDFGLLEMVAEAGSCPAGAKIDVRTVEPAWAADLRARAATILIL